MDKAIVYAEKADEIIKNTDDYAWQTRVSGFLASQYRFLKLYDKSDIITKSISDSKEN